MKGLWRKYLGLAAASLLAGSAQAADPAPAADTLPRAVIARAGDTGSSFASSSPNQQTANPTLPPGRGASIGRHVFAGSGPSAAPEVRPFAVSLERPRIAEFGVQRTAFQVAPRPVVRAQSSELIPSPGSVSPPTAAAGSSGPGLGMPMFSSPLGSADGMTTGIDPDRFGIGDGVSHEFNNFISLENEYLLWHMRGADVPPLVTTGLAAAPAFVPGALMMRPTMVLFGGNSEDTEMHSGFRTRLKLWIDRDHTIGLEGSYMFLAQGSMDFSRSSAGVPLLAVPFARANGTQGAVILADVNTGIRGGARASLMNRLWGAEANVRGNILAGPSAHLDLIGGFRAMGLDDSFEFAASRTNGTLTQSTHDSFATRNRFYGGQLGAEAEWRHGRWSLGATGKVALGNNNQQVEISGSSRGLPGAGGLFASANNSNRFERDRFSVVPEVGVKVGYQVTDCMRASLGYNFLYWSDVVRATEQIDPVLVGTGRPAFAFKSADFWAHGLTAGLELRY